MIEATPGGCPGVDRPPPVPASQMALGPHRAQHLLLWVRTGSARLDLDDGTVQLLGGGEGLWVPAGVTGRLTTCPGSVVFPHQVPWRSTPGAPLELVRFRVPDGWQDRLVLHFVRDVVRIPSQGYPSETVLDVLRAAGATPRPPARPSQPVDPPGQVAPLPTAVGARWVALELLAHPALRHGIEQWAVLAACSASTLRRGFAETGLTFAQWRIRARLAAGCDLLAGGDDVERAAALVGFASRNGFTRAFGEHYRMTPREYVAGLRRAPGAVPGVLTGPGSVTPARPLPGPLPPRHAPRHTNRIHVLSWVFRGGSELRIGGTRYPNRQGDAIWIPAGVEHEYATREDSLALPVGDLLAGEAQIEQPLRTRFPASWDDYLLHRVVATRTALRPEGFDRRDVLDVFREQLAGERARTVPMPSDPRARAVADRFLRRLREPVGARPDPVVDRAFWRETGLTLARWRATARMRVARDLLADGVRPGAVARRVGFRYPSNFSRAYRRFHGMSPEQYRRSATGRPS